MTVTQGSAKSSSLEVIPCQAGAHLISFHTIPDQIPKPEMCVPQSTKFLPYSEDFKFVDTAILGSLLVATPHIDGSDLKLPTEGNGENGGQT